MKDPTRGGLANTLNEWSERSKVGISIYEEDIPMREGVKSACEMLGIDPLEVGNEGKIVIASLPEKADEVLNVLRQTKEGKEAKIIGEVTNEFNQVVLKTRIGGKRIVSPPVGDPIPRICWLRSYVLVIVNYPNSSENTFLILNERYRSI